MTARGRIGNRGDIALIVGGGGLGALRQEMRARANSRTRLDRLEPDKRGPRGVSQSSARGHEAADEILFGRKHPAHTEIVRRGLAVQLTAGGVPLLDAE